MEHQRKSIGGLGNLMFKEAYLYSQMLEGQIPDVFLQSEKYFMKYKDFIRERFSTGIGYIDHVSIHVRRGDYVDNPFYVDIFKDGYYERAMALFPENTFIVFSDDIEWCKKQPIFMDCVFSEGKSEVEDLNLMASCRDNILANSSFSWWAGWLNPNPDKKVVVPKKWFTDGVERVDLPGSWVKI